MKVRAQIELSLYSVELPVIAGSHLCPFSIQRLDTVPPKLIRKIAIKNIKNVVVNIPFLLLLKHSRECLSYFLQ